MNEVLSITELLRNTHAVCKGVKNGRKYTVFSRSRPVFNILPIKNHERNLSLEQKNIKLPSFQLNLKEDIYSRKDIYDNYLRKICKTNK